MVAGAIVVILAILVIILVVILIKHKKNRSHTVQVDNDMADYYDTVENSIPDYRAVGEPPGDDNEDDDSDEGIVEDKVGHLYDGVNKPKMKRQFDQETQEYDDIVTQPGVKITGLGPISTGYDDIVTQPPGVKITGLGPILAGYDDIEIACPNTTVNIKHKTKIKETKLVGGAVYALPGISKKKGKKDVDKEQEMDLV